MRRLPAGGGPDGVAVRELDPVAPAEGARQLLLGGGDAQPGLVRDVVDAAGGQQLGQRPGLGRDLGRGLGPGGVLGRAGRVGPPPRMSLRSLGACGYW